MERRKFLGAAGVGALAAGVLASARPAKAAAEYNWRMANLYPRGTSYGVDYQGLADWIEKASNGRIHIDVLFDGEGVGATEVLQATAAGLVEVGCPYMALHAGELPAGIVELGLPGGARYLDGLLALFWRGGWVETLQEAYASIGLQYVAPYFQPAVYIITNKPLNTLADLNGMKIRAPGGYGKFMAQFGAQPVTMAFSETYTALATGVIDGCCSSNLIDYRDGKFYEIAKYFYPVPATESQVSPLVINKGVWDGLPQDLKDIITLAGIWHGNAEANESTISVGAAVKEMEAGGMVWGKGPDDADKAKWKAAADALLPEYEKSDPFSAKLVQQQRDFLAKTI
jgi:TRAP-type C4-dicarboxylate transport system substrate-binding protein